MNTVTECKHLKFWEKDGKKVPIFLVTLSDGRNGQAFSKEIPVGTKEDEIEITEGQYGLKFKLKSSGNAFGGRPQLRAGNESFALSYSKDWAIAQLEKGVSVKTDDILIVADKFYEWLESKKKL